MNKHNMKPSEQTPPDSIFIGIPEAAQIIGCSYSKAQQAVSTCNQRAKSMGLFTLSGKCNRRALLEYLVVYQESFFANVKKGK